MKLAEFDTENVADWYLVDHNYPCESCQNHSPDNVLMQSPSIQFGIHSRCLVRTRTRSAETTEVELGNFMKLISTSIVALYDWDVGLQLMWIGLDGHCLVILHWWHKGWLECHRSIIIWSDSQSILGEYPEVKRSKIAENLPWCNERHDHNNKISMIGYEAGVGPVLMRWLLSQNVPSSSQCQILYAFTQFRSDPYSAVAKPRNVAKLNNHTFS
jgi:hypothetical protein